MMQLLFSQSMNLNYSRSSMESIRGKGAEQAAKELRQVEATGDGRLFPDNRKCPVYQ
jgi:hypothetical protein